MKLGAIVVLIFIIALLFLTIFCVKKSISDDRKVQEEYEERQKAGIDKTPEID